MARGKLIVISAPSGAGKTSIAQQIMKLNPSLTFSVSATTRPRRTTETEGKEYFFLSQDEFIRRVERGEFVEWEQIYDQCYGTLKSEIDRAMNAGHHLLFDLDVKGGLSIKKQYPEACLIFIRPPSIDILRQRLEGRRTENNITLQKRLERVPMELKLGYAFDHQVENDELGRAVEEVQKIVIEHLRN
jgi:guanylate kinase